jgi:hypothetical protein
VHAIAELVRVDDFAWHRNAASPARERVGEA